MDRQARTIGDLHAEAKRRVGDDAVARWMCEVACGTDDVLSFAAERANDTMATHLDEMLARHAAGEPLAYVLGRWGFRHLDLAVDRRVLIPRPETEVVAGVAIDLARGMGTPLTVADLGTGSGAIGLSMAGELAVERPPRENLVVWLTDASDAALDVARANLAGLGMRGAGVRIAEPGEWFHALPAGTVLDLAVSNPPYIAEGSPHVDRSVLDWEPSEALVAGPDGLDAICELVAAAPAWVRPGGWLVLEIGADQGDAVATLLADAGYDAVDIQPDLAGRDRVAVARVG